MERLLRFFKISNRAKVKKWLYILCVCALVFWLCFRIVSLILQHNETVFNIARDVQENGTPVLTMTAQNSSGSLREPVTVENNRAYVTGNRVGLFRPGQLVGNGKITSVSQNINLDTGMYVIKTSGVENGLQYVEYTRNGYFVPVYAIVNENVFVYENGKAVSRHVIVAHSDANTALITQGLHDGDIVILSHVSDGERVRIENKTDNTIDQGE
ncbi:MAG: hypothetical protein KBT14_00250 [Proteobacteria bacterium]|nr:hypothetical protein [Candidatus Enterousia onthequi]